MARLYSNENFPFPVVQELRRLGQDVVTIQDTGLAGQAISDEAVLDFACSEGRALVTLNRKHFVRLHRQDNNHCGIIVCSFDSDFIGLAHRIHEAIKEQANLSKQLIRIKRPNM
jgi:hypothetical protein